MAETRTRRAVDAATVAEAFRITSEQHAGEVAIRTKDDETAITWGEWRRRSDRVSAGLAALGVRGGDTVAMLLINRPEFHLVDVGVMQLGATPFSIYMTYAPNQIAYAVGDAASRVIITEEAFLPNVLKAK